MDRLISNEINTLTNEKSKEINEFMHELQNALDKPNSKLSKISIDQSLYDEIYNELKLAPKYKDKLESIIKDCLLNYSYDTEFVYVNYDEKSKKYYMDYYYGDVTKINVTKKEIQDADYKIGSFYFPMSDGKYLDEADYVKDIIKENVEYKLNNLEKGSINGK